MKLNYISVLPFLCLSLLSCTTVRVVQKDGSVSVERHFGFIEIKPIDNASIVTANVTSFGYASTPLGYNLGFSQQSVTTASEACHFVIWIDESTNQQEVIEVLETLDGSCVIKH